MAVDDPLEHIAQAAAIASRKQMVLAAQRHRPDRAFDGIGVQVHTAIVQEARQTFPAGECVPDRFGKRAAAGHASKLRFEPGMQGLRYRLGERAPLSDPMGRRLPTQARFDDIEFADPAQGLRRYGRTGGLGNLVELASCVCPQAARTMSPLPVRCSKPA